MKKIILIGLPGSGKTSLSNAFSGIDTDNLLAGHGTLAKYIHSCESVEDFIRQEGIVVRDTISNHKSKVVATGGSVVHDPKTVEYLKDTKHTVVWLDILDRSRGSDEHERGVVYPDGISTREDLIAFRVPLYQSLAHVTIRTDIFSIVECIRILKSLIYS